MFGVDNTFKKLTPEMRSEFMRQLIFENTKAARDSLIIVVMFGGNYPFEADPIFAGLLKEMLPRQNFQFPPKPEEYRPRQKEFEAVLAECVVRRIAVEGQKPS